MLLCYQGGHVETPADSSPWYASMPCMWLSMHSCFVFIQGDLRADNFFRQKEGTDYAYIDFQFIRSDNPGFELYQLFAVNLGDKSDHARLPELIKIYHDVATANMPPEVTQRFTLEDANRDFVLGTTMLFLFACTGVMTSMIESVKDKNHPIMQMFHAQMLPRVMSVLHAMDGVNVLKGMINQS